MSLSRETHAQTPAHVMSLSRESHAQTPVRVMPLSKETHAQTPARVISLTRETHAQTPAHVMSLSRETHAQTPARVTSLSKESHALTPGSVSTRDRAQSLLTPGRRQRRVSHLNKPRISQTSSVRKRRESRYVMTSAPISLTSEQVVAPEVKEPSKTNESGGFFDKNLSKIELFRRTSKLIQLFSSLCLYSHHSEKSKEELTKHTVFTEYLKEEEQEQETLQSELYFDLSYFKANRKMYVSAETKHVLSSPANTRTEQQIAKVKYWLSNIRSFAEYPRRMQQKLIQVGWYEGHRPKRVLIRQGHRPQAFYFLLSGSAVVTVMDKKSHISRTVHFLKRGDSFGELAILHDTVRQSTIITREFSELLVISKEDFVDIFMASGGVKNITDPDHADFIKSINFLKDWPIELLALNPKRCLFHFFRRGAVLVKESNRSDWIYIIKSGSCRILKKLKEVQSRLTEHQNRVVGFERVSSRITNSTEQFNKVRMTISALNAFKPKRSATSQAILNNNNDINDGQSEVKSKESDAIEKVAEAQFPHGKKSSGRRSAEEKSRKRGGSNVDRQSSMPISNKLDRRKSVDFPPLSESDKSTANATSSWFKLRSVIGSQNKKTNITKRRTSKSNKSLRKKQELVELPSNTLSFLDEEDTKKEELAPLEQSDHKPVFVEVATLTKGDTFGVNFMFLENQPSLSLVSNGVECIVISKKLFLSHCTEAMKRRLLLEEQPFPDDETLQKNLQDKINWETFKTKTLHSTISNLPPSCRRASLPDVTYDPSTGYS